jgi:hypothetical protein
VTFAALVLLQFVDPNMRVIAQLVCSRANFDLRFADDSTVSGAGQSFKLQEWQLTLVGFAIGPVFAVTMAVQEGLVVKCEVRNERAWETVASG